MGCGVVPAVGNLLGQKAIDKIERIVFLIVHRAKVTHCVYTPWTTRTAVAGLDFGVVDVMWGTTRQKLPSFRFGIVDIRCAMDDAVVESLAGMCVWLAGHGHRRSRQRQWPARGRARRIERDHLEGAVVSGSECG